jgi:pimeloyl-ACP methyl ester carboxylesterase
MPVYRSADGAELFYLDWGQGRPVVLLHGTPLDGDQWEYQLPALLSQGYRAIIPDRRGFGRSNDIGQGFDYDTFADDLEALIRRLDLGSVRLVAHSSGAGDVVRYFARHGGRCVTSLLLVAPVTPFLLQTPDNAAGVPVEVVEAQLAMLCEDRPAFNLAAVSAFLGEEYQPSAEFLRWGLDHAARASLVAHTATFRAFMTTDFRNDLPAVTAPTLVIHEDRDQATPLALTGQRTAAAIPQCEIRVHSGSSHAPFFTSKRRFNQELLEFLERT